MRPAIILCITTLALLSTLSAQASVGPEMPATPQLVLQTGVHATAKVQFSPDGKLFATTGGLIWDVARGVLLRTLPSTHIGDAVAFSPDGTQLVTGGDDNVVTVWDVASGAVVRRMTRHSDTVDAVAWSPDGKWIASGSSDQTVRIWNASTGELVQTLTGHQGNVLYLAFRPDSAELASADNGGIARIWDLAGKADPKVYKLGEPIEHLVFSGDGTSVLVATDDNDLLELDDAKPGAFKTTFKCGDDAGQLSLNLSPGGTSAAYTKTNIGVYVRDLATGKESMLVPSSTGHYVGVAGWLGDDKLAVNGDDGLRLFDLVTKQMLAAFPTASFSLTGLAIAIDGRSVSLTDEIGNVASLDLSDDSISVVTIPNALNDSAHAIVSGDRKLAACTPNQTDIDLTLLRTETTRVFTHPKVEGIDNGSAQSLAFNPSGSILAAVLDDGQILAIDTKQGIQYTLVGHTQAVASLGFAPDGETIISASEDGTIRKWRLPHKWSVKTVWDVADNPGAIGGSSMGLSPDTRYLAQSSGGAGIMDADHGDVTVTVRDTSNGQVMRRIRVGSATLDSLTFSAGDRKLAAVSGSQLLSGEYHLIVWDTDSRKPLLKLSLVDFGVGSMRFSPDGNLLFTSESDSAVAILNANTGEKLAAVSLLGGKAWVAQFPDGRYDGSPEGLAKLRWVTGLTSAPVDSRAPELHAPRALSALLAPHMTPETPITLAGGEKMPTGGPRLIIETHEDKPGSPSLAYNPTGTLLVSIDGLEADVWNPSTGAQVSSLQDLGGLGEAYWLDDRRIASQDGEKRAAVWDARTGSKIRTLTDAPPVRKRKPTDINDFSAANLNIALKVSPDRNLIAVGTGDSVTVFDAKTLTVVDRITLDSSSDVYPRFEFDGNDLLTATFGNSAPRYYIARTGKLASAAKQPKRIDTNEQWIRSPDGSRTASYSDNPEVTLWDGKTAKPLYTLDQLSISTLVLTFSRDSRYLAGGDAAGNVVIWSAKTGKPLATLTGHTQIISGLAFSPDSSTLASAGGDGTIRIWKVP